ncbi:hypothetical protein FKG94_22170 [Exilibacterium tricleocarpae]|uniref:Uncharacterized protein n=1 Tax=Exilibacterium tricleocarpae TaxID=2591008 RepID=A0A545SY17_9GAMM|nr:hypothetical protein [Exilibacterium tricleocarpae]TQV69861.1 hypothetical protein FKG94_22170 [Exilibacterium tricleocarpae]
MSQKSPAFGPKAVTGGRSLKAVSSPQQSTWRYPSSVIPAERLGAFFDNDEEDEALFAQLQMERKLYRLLNSCDTREAMARQVTGILTHLGFAEYSFVRLDVLQRDEGNQALMPKMILSSHGGEKFESGGMILQATADDPRARHLSMLYHFIASLPANGLENRGGRYMLIISAGDAGCYITHSGTPKKGRYLSICSPEDRAEDIFRQHVANNQQTLDLLVNSIEGVGIKKFPQVFEANKKSTAAKINPRPLRLLNTLAKKDVTLRQAADLLHLSTDTINKHVAAAKTALGTTTIAGTVWKAIKEGLIDERN